MYGEKRPIRKSFRTSKDVNKKLKDIKKIQKYKEYTESDIVNLALNEFLSSKYGKKKVK